MQLREFSNHDEKLLDVATKAENDDSIAAATMHATKTLVSRNDTLKIALMESSKLLKESGENHLVTSKTCLMN